MTLTLLTALIDLARGNMSGRFQRGIKYYTDSLDQLLRLPFPKVIYLDRKIDGYMEDDNTRIIRVDEQDLKRFPFYDRVQEIRCDPRWCNQVPWLKESPQCQLPGYNPLVMSKMIWLGELAIENPFATEGVFWLDAGIYNNRQFAWYGHLNTITRTIGERYSYLTRKCHDRHEVHGFERSAFDRYCGQRFADTIVAGGLFGGSISSVTKAHSAYMQVAEETLSAGFMGTEENLLTIMMNRHRNPPAP